jgi:hypothetical protein
MDTKVCRTCDVEKSIEDFYVRSNRPGRYNQCKDCRNSNKARRESKKKKRLKDWAGGECSRCGYSECYSALEFHHTNPENKDFNPSATASHGMERLKEEARKCVLLCANCHREVDCDNQNCDH